MPICPNCGSKGADNAIFCDQCGTRLPAAEPPAQETVIEEPVGGVPEGVFVCPVCGAENVPGEVFCDACGEPLEAPEPVNVKAVEAEETVEAEAVVAEEILPVEPLAEEAVVEAEPIIEEIVIEAAIEGEPVMEEIEPQPAGENEVYCPACGATARPDDTFCSSCGASLQEAETEEEEPVGEPVIEEEPVEDLVLEAEPIEGVVAEEEPAGAATVVVEREPAEKIIAEAEAAPDLHCSVCGASVLPDQVFCASCGAAIKPAEASAPAPVAPTGPYLEVVSSGAHIPLANQPELEIGRLDEVSGVYPDVDMTPHGGEEGGVSRRHARLIREGDAWAIVDLDSTNGTYINGTEMTAKSQQGIADGDTISLGDVEVVFHTG
ncbi:MAG: zinc ribbon domain-containing protein [Anaerolineae bacterium]|nr:zinc ribbon domain-containing protein [Anaerolineae bacterium]